ncbi:OC116 protein, partial [Nicator chloris]|nr:OC116 protein [Nicator chloris]
MQTSVVCLCLCLLSTALATPVSMAFPGKKIVCFGYFLPHQMVLKGCNAKHGFHFFKFVYFYTSQRNQTQIK